MRNGYLILEIKIFPMAHIRENRRFSRMASFSLLLASSRSTPNSCESKDQQCIMYQFEVY